MRLLVFILCVSGLSTVPLKQNTTFTINTALEFTEDQIGTETSKLVTQDLNALIGYTYGWPLGSIKIVDDTH